MGGSGKSKKDKYIEKNLEEAKAVSLYSHLSQITLYLKSIGNQTTFKWSFKIEGQRAKPKCREYDIKIKDSKLKHKLQW